MSEARDTPSEFPWLGRWMLGTGIVIGWITCSLFWPWMGWLPS